jgi:hypothetical protein
MATDTNTERVIFIEYRAGRPFSIETTTTEDASYGETYAVDAEEGVRRRKRAPGKRAFERVLNGDWTVSRFQEGRCEFCPTCDDYLPSEDCDELCEHVWFCGESGDWSKPGERCPWDCEECREEGRETGPPPPMIVLAQGYGMAASELGSLTRRLLARHGFTPGSLAERFGCGARCSPKRPGIAWRPSPLSWDSTTPSGTS